MKLQKGFTLIELVIIIIILGILAAFLLPKFGNIEREARIATVYGLEGSIRGASAIAHSSALVQNVTTGTVYLGGTAAQTNPVAIVNGYPDSTNTGISATLESTRGFGDPAGTAGGSIVFDKDGTTGGVCAVTYNAAAAGAAPTITIATGGC